MRRGSLGDEFHRAVVTVADRTGEEEFVRFARGPVPESDALDHAAHASREPHSIVGRTGVRFWGLSHGPNVTPRIIPRQDDPFLQVPTPTWSKFGVGTWRSLELGRHDVVRCVAVRERDRAAVVV